MPDQPDPTLAAIEALLDRDEAYDRDPHGPPPIRTAQYRAALRAAIATFAAEPPAELTSPERVAYNACQAATVAAVHCRVARALDIATPATAETL